MADTYAIIEESGGQRKVTEGESIYIDLYNSGESKVGDTIEIDKVLVVGSAGGDAKLIAVPHDKLTQLYKDVKEYTDLPPLLIEQIKHFFENYKDLEKGKWVKVEGWGNADAARAEIVKAVAAYQK